MLLILHISNTNSSTKDTMISSANHTSNSIGSSTSCSSSRSSIVPAVAAVVLNIVVPTESLTSGTNSSTSIKSGIAISPKTTEGCEQLLAFRSCP